MWAEEKKLEHHSWEWFWNENLRLNNSNTERYFWHIPMLGTHTGSELNNNISNQIKNYSRLFTPHNPSLFRPPFKSVQNDTSKKVDIIPHTNELLLMINANCWRMIKLIEKHGIFLIVGSFFSEANPLEGNAFNVHTILYSINNNQKPYNQEHLLTINRFEEHYTKLIPLFMSCKLYCCKCMFSVYCVVCSST